MHFIDSNLQNVKASVTEVTEKNSNRKMIFDSGTHKRGVIYPECLHRFVILWMPAFRLHHEICLQD